MFMQIQACPDIKYKNIQPRGKFILFFMYCNRCFGYFVYLVYYVNFTHFGILTN